MKDLVRRQLEESIATMQAVLADAQIHETLVAVGKLTADALKSGRVLMVAGNGGSAADAQHLVAEFVSRLTVNRSAMRAIALTTDTSILTAVANDFSYDYVFARQIEALGQAGDVFLGISTSGNSKNLLRAVDEARRRGMHTVGFTGAGGGAMREVCHYTIAVPSTTTMNIQESHLALEHIFCMIVERFTFGMDFDKAPQILSE